MPISNSVPDQAEGLRRMAQPRPVRVITIASGKGGVGKTNISVNLATAFANLGRRTMIFDADLGLGNVDVVLGLHPQYNLSHVIKGERSLEEIIVDAPGGIKVIPASSGLKSMTELTTVEHAGLIRAFSELSSEVDVLLVDAAAGISDTVVNFSRAAQEVIVVVCDEPASITDAYALIKLLNRDPSARKYRIRVVTNMVESEQEGRELFQKMVRVTDRFLDEVVLEHVGSVPFDDYMRKAIKKQRSVVESYPRSRSALAFQAMSRKIDAWPFPASRSGYLEFFMERVVQSQSDFGALP